MGGTPLPDIGGICNICDDILWPAGKPPAQMWLSVAGIEKSEHWIVADLPPANGTFLMNQDGVDKCHWFYHAAGIFARFTIEPDRTTIIVSRDFVDVCFINIIFEVCITAMENFLDGRPGHPFQGGDAFVYW